MFLTFDIEVGNTKKHISLHCDGKKVNEYFIIDELQFKIETNENDCIKIKNMMIDDCCVKHCFVDKVVMRNDYLIGFNIGYNYFIDDCVLQYKYLYDERNEMCKKKDKWINGEWNIFFYWCCVKI